MWCVLKLVKKRKMYKYRYKRERLYAMFAYISEYLENSKKAHNGSKAECEVRVTGRFSSIVYSLIFNIFNSFKRY
jgi:hypothetical protein